MTRSLWLRPLATIVLLAAGAPAGAWEVIGPGGGAVPTFAANFVGNDSAPAGGFAAGLASSAPVTGFNPGYDARIGKKFLIGVDARTGLAARDGMFGFAPGFDVSRTSVKFGYDMGAFKPFVATGFTDIRTSSPIAFSGSSFGIGIDNYTNGVPIHGTGFAPSARANAVGAGFDYAITDKLSLGVSVSATQVQSGWQR
jgi:opacity protein-like surface antigen